MAHKKANDADHGYQNGDGTPYGHFEVIGHSNGSSNAPSHTRRAASHFPRPKHEDKVAPEPHGMGKPAVIGHSGGKKTTPMPRYDGSSFTPAKRSAKQPLSPIGGTGPHQPHSGDTIRSTSLGSKPLRWDRRDYRMPVGVEKLDE